MEYKISLDYDDYFAHSTMIYSANIEVVGESIMFETNKDSLLYLDSKNIRYMLHDSKNEKIKQVFKNKNGMFIGIFIAIFLVVMNTFRVSEIKVNGEYPINDEVINNIKSNEKKLFTFSFMNLNYEAKGKELRSIFYEYEWISVSKKGSVIYVDVVNSGQTNNKDNDVVLGDLISKCDAMISSYMVFSGKGIIKENQLVKKGDILIKGEAKGYILGVVYEEINITVMKENKEEVKTGNVNKYNLLNIFGKDIRFNESSYLKKETQEELVFNIPWVLKINKIEEYEKNDIIKVYNKEEAIKKAITLIKTDFEGKKVLNDETILRIEPLITTDNNDSFIITFLVKKIISIGEYKS